MTEENSAEEVKPTTPPKIKKAIAVSGAPKTTPPKKEELMGEINKLSKKEE